jgi:hypothetical protein
MRDGYQRKTNEVFIAREASWLQYGRTFGPCAPTRVCRFENRASCAGYPDGQANSPTFQYKVHRRRDGRVAVDTCCGLINMY